MSPPIPVRPLRRFDAFGSVDVVLHAIDINIPRIFPQQASPFTVALKKMVRQYSHQYGWNTVVLTVSQGLPEEEMESFLAVQRAHRGPVVIDPTLHDPHNYFFTSVDDVKKDADLMTSLCEGRNDALVILYGVDGISHIETIRLLQARLTMLNMTFELLKVDIRPDPHPPFDPQLLTKDLNRLDLARTVLGEINEVLDKNIRDNLDPDGNAVSGAIMSARNELQYLIAHAYEPEVKHNLHVADMQLQNIPEQFRELNLAPPEPTPRPEPAPTLHHPDLRHNPIYSDEMNPRPKY